MAIKQPGRPRKPGLSVTTLTEARADADAMLSALADFDRTVAVCCRVDDRIAVRLRQAVSALQALRGALR